MIEWYWLVLASSVLMAVATIIEKYALKAEHATQFSAAFSWIIALVSLVFIPYAIFNISMFQWFLLVVGSILSAATYLITARVYKHGSISIATSVYSALPLLFIVILAYIFLGEYLSLIQYAALAGIIVATYLLLFKGGAKLRNDFDGGNKYKYMMVINAVIVAVSTIIGKYQLVNINFLAYLIITQIFMAIEFAIFISVKYNGVKEIVQTTKTYKYPLITIVLLTIGYRLTYYFALSSPTLPVSIAAPLRNTLFTIMTVLVGGMMFKEKGMVWKVGMSVVMVALALILTF
ncbi:MAG: EamA family transporter [Candidatus Micrarchaeales archaeon]